MSETRFIRKGGRIIPIKVKKGIGSRGGRLRADRNTKQKIGKAIINTSFATQFATFLAPAVGTIAAREGLRHAHESIIAANKARIGIAFKDIENAKKFAKVSKKHFVKQKAYKGIADFSLSLTKNQGKVLLGSLAGIGLGAIIANKGHKQRSNETRLLNKYRERK